MTTLSTKELYAMFLDSDWWRNLSRTKRMSVEHCQRCPTVAPLESHHLVYRDNWFDTVLDDLQVLCRTCHQKEHEPKPIVRVEVKVEVSVRPQGFQPRKKQKKIKQRWRKTRKGKWTKQPKPYYTPKPYKVKRWMTFNCSRKRGYVNRGTSSN